MSNGLRLGSLCSGAGMLDVAVGTLLPVEHAWHAETDPAASRVLAAHWPDVANLGDITRPNGSGPYGLPRRRLSAPRRARQAVKRRNRRIEGWLAMAERPDVLAAGFPCQPVSAAGRRLGSADERYLWASGVEPAVAALMPSLLVVENVPGLVTAQRGRLFAEILADLDGLGYAVSWTTVGACLVGACHHRHRVFLAATTVDVAAPGGEPFARRDGNGWTPVQDVLFGDPQPVRWPTSGVAVGGLVWALPTPTARDATRGAGRATPEGRPLSEVIALLPTPTETAVRRQEAAFGLPAPEPTEPGRLGKPRLSPLFPEWMIGLPAGWITDHVGRNDAIRIAGNGVVVPQAAYALDTLPTFRAYAEAVAVDAVVGEPVGIGGGA